MRVRCLPLCLVAIVLLSLGGRIVAAAELQCDIKSGDSVGAYTVVKCGGIDDGVAVGKKLCYL